VSRRLAHEREILARLFNWGQNFSSARCPPRPQLNKLCDVRRQKESNVNTHTAGLVSCVCARPLLLYSPLSHYKVIVHSLLLLKTRRFWRPGVQTRPKIGAHARENCSSPVPLIKEISFSRCVILQHHSRRTGVNSICSQWDLGEIRISVARICCTQKFIFVSEITG
jgi:hypothetical protein